MRSVKIHSELLTRRYADKLDGEALKSALASLAGAVSDSGAHITAKPLPSLPVHGMHLQQLFQNIIAMRYRSPDRPPIVHVAAQRQDGCWMFSVSDNGIGIEPQYKENIFGLFKRLHTSDEYIQEPALDWPSVSESCIGTMGESGSNPNPDEDLTSTSRSPSDDPRAGIHAHVLIVEDNESDVFLIQEAIEATKLPLMLHVVKDREQAVRFFDRADGDPGHALSRPGHSRYQSAEKARRRSSEVYAPEPELRQVSRDCDLEFGVGARPGANDETGRRRVFSQAFRV